MLKQTVKYKDFDGNEVEEDFYFNFSMLEMIEQVEIHKVHERMTKLTRTNDASGAYSLFKQLVLDSYGEKSMDGRKFHKSDAIRADFEASAAISELIIGFLSDAELGIAFVRGVLPQEMLDIATAQVNAKEQEKLNPGAGVQPIRPVPTMDVSAQKAAMEAQPGYHGVDHVAAAEDERERPGTPLDQGVTMSTAEKRQYTSDELDAIQGVPGTVPVAPSHPVGQSEYSDEEVLAMSAQELNQKGLLMRAYNLKAQS